MELKEVLLDFTKVDFSDAHACDERDLIHRTKMRQFEEIFNAQIAKAEEEYRHWNKNSHPSKVHNTISVFANRGAGKTTFLLSAIKWMQDTQKDVLCLSPIDPSMIGDKEKTFVIILAEIHERVQKKMDQFDLDGIDGEDNSAKQRKIQRCFNDLIKALSFKDGIGKSNKYEDWDDTEYAAIRGMERAIASNNIDKLFQNYIYQALNLLDKKCIVLSFDDIDTDFNKGYEILEVIRKLLTTPMVITILTGDLELYGKLVRKASWKCFDQNLLDKEKTYAKRNEKEFSTMVDQLENQYLVKILKPEYRIHIGTISEYLAEKDFSINVRFGQSDPENGYPIGNCYDRLLEEIGAHRKGGKLEDDLKQFLLGLSLRIQIRLLSLIKEHNLMKNFRHDKERLAQGIQSVFWNDINQKVDNAKALIKQSPNYTVEMLRFLTMTKSFGSGTSFLPQTQDEILNKALFAIGTKYNELVGTYKHLIFDYWGRIALASTFYNRINQIGLNEFDTFLEKSQLTSDSGLMRCCGLMHAQCNFYPGLSVNNIAGTESLPEVPFVYAELETLLALLPSYGIEDSNNQKETAFLSIHKLIAIIADLMKFCETKNLNAENRLARIMVELTKLGQYRTFMAAPSNMSSDQESFEKGQKNFYNHFMFDEEFIGHNNQMQELAMKFIDWEMKKVSVSCQSLNQIYTRFYYTLTHIDGNYSISDRFNKFVLALLNAALVETAIDNGLANFNMSNTGDVEYIYMNNLRQKTIEVKKNAKIEEAFGFYNWLADCPLLLMYIDPVVKIYITKLQDISPQEADVWVKYHNRSKMIRYIDQNIKHQDKIVKSLKLKQKDIQDINDFLQNQDRYNNNRLYIRREYFVKEHLERLIKENELLSKKLNETRNKIRPIVVYDGKDVSLDSDIPSAQSVLNTIIRDIHLAESLKSTMEGRKTMASNLFSQIGLTDRFELWEQEAYHTIQGLNIYNLIEKLYPLYKDDESTAV